MNNDEFRNGQCCRVAKMTLAFLIGMTKQCEFTIGLSSIRLKKKGAHGFLAVSVVFMNSSITSLN